MPQIHVNVEVKIASFQNADAYILDEYLEADFFGAVGGLCLFYQCSKPLLMPCVSENINVSCAYCVMDKMQMIVLR